MNQLSIFDLTPNPELESLSIPAPGQPEPEPVPEVSPWFDFTIPDSPDITSILGIGDRVLILPAKYDLKPNVPGIVKAFVLGEVVVQRRDGEGLYQRKELHRVPTEK
jgi:hypothetical protein